MYGGFRGRSGPTKSTPANVQCQKCLKRGHYSYECKSSTQERPYVSRPSRSQQLRNPKLVPKLTNNKLEELEKKEGAADAELAKKEAERTKQRDLDSDDAVDERKSRARSASSASVSTISTNSRASASPPRRRSRSPIKNRSEFADSVQHSDDRQRRYSSSRSRSPSRRDDRHEHKTTSNHRSRQRSMSPFSKRMAMSKDTH